MKTALGLIGVGMMGHGMMGGGPAPMTAKDRSQFLQSLDNAVQASLRELK